MTAVLYGIIGMVIGYKVPWLSHEIIRYKKKEISTNCNFLFSTHLQLLLSLFNGAVWYMAALNAENKLVAMLIGLIIITGLITAYVDICIRIIPNEIVLLFVVLGLLFQISHFGVKTLLAAFISMIVLMVVFTAVAAFIGFGKVGAGDVKLAGAMGLTLGYPLIIIAVMAMAVVLLVFIGVGMLLKKIYLSTMLPLAPFIVSGMIISIMTVLF